MQAPPPELRAALETTSLLRRRAHRLIGICAAETLVVLAAVSLEEVLLRDTDGDACARSGLGCPRSESSFDLFLMTILALFMKLLLLGSMFITTCSVEKYGAALVFKDLYNMLCFFRFLTLVLLSAWTFNLFTSWETSTNHNKLCSTGVIIVTIASLLCITKRYRSLSRSLRDARDAQEREARAKELDHLLEVEAGSLISNSSDSQLQCVICLQNLDSRDKVIQLPCRHIFHPDCIRDWLIDPKNTQCPYRCREDPRTPASTSVIEPEEGVNEAPGEASPSVRALPTAPGTALSL
mmetsp:Transcript_21761/g.47552  ORF Transcript_21761/g.47552 Transcript_21761/m.47552 type:complete len:295 (-) Transcript_21761:71-955(-)